MFAKAVRQFPFFALGVPVVLLKLGMVLATTTATARKMSLESKQLCYCDYFAIFQSCSHFAMLAKRAMTRLVCTSLNKNKESNIYGCMFKLSSNIVISSFWFGEDATKLLVSACRSCNTLIFPYSINQILNMWHRRCSSRRWPCFHELVV